MAFLNRPSICNKMAPLLQGRFPRDKGSRQIWQCWHKSTNLISKETIGSNLRANFDNVLTWFLFTFEILTSKFLRRYWFNILNQPEHLSKYLLLLYQRKRAQEKLSVKKISLTWMTSEVTTLISSAFCLLLWLSSITTCGITLSVKRRSCISPCLPSTEVSEQF